MASLMCLEIVSEPLQFKCVLLHIGILLKRRNGVLNIGGLSLDIEYIFTDFYCYVHRVGVHFITQP